MNHRTIQPVYIKIMFRGDGGQLLQRVNEEQAGTIHTLSILDPNTIQKADDLYTTFKYMRCTLYSNDSEVYKLTYTIIHEISLWWARLITRARISHPRSESRGFVFPNPRVRLTLWRDRPTIHASVVGAPCVLCIRTRSMSAWWCWNRRPPFLAS